MKASEILHHFMERSDWVDPKDTVDGITFGNPDKTIRTILVTWMNGLDVIQEAIDRKIDMIVSHEATFYNHESDREWSERCEIARHKRNLLIDHDIVLLRNHDSWDRFPHHGIPWSWGRFLGLGDTPVAISDDRYQHRYDIERVSLGEFAFRVAKRTATLGEPSIQVMGDPTTPVQRIGIGTGCLCSPDIFRSLGCDVSIVVDDGTLWWRELQRSRDLDHPILRVNHATSEEPGMIALTKYLQDQFPDIAIHHHPHKPYFRCIGEG